jgi:hypothetical protein
MATGQMDYLTGILRRLVFRITELLEQTPTEGETEKAPTSEWAYNIERSISERWGCGVSLSANFDLTHGNLLLLPFDTIDYDTGDEFDIITHIYTAKTTGIYLVNLRYRGDTMLNSMLHGRIKVNDVTIISRYERPNESSFYGGLLLVGTLNLIEDDEVKAYGYQWDYTGANDLSVHYGSQFTYFSVHRIG